MPEDLPRARPGVSLGIQEGARIQSGRVNQPVFFAAYPGVGLGPSQPPLPSQLPVPLWASVPSSRQRWKNDMASESFSSSCASFASNLSWSESRGPGQCPEEAGRAFCGISHSLLKFGYSPREGAEHPGQPPGGAERLLGTRPRLSSLHEKLPPAFLQPTCGRG